MSDPAEPANDQPDDLVDDEFDDDEFDEDEEAEGPQPDWWHRDHPTFTRLMGFFTGLAYLALVPAAFLAVLDLVFDDQVARALSPLLATTLIVPVGMMFHPRTRVFARYMLFGMLITAVVVVGVSALVLWVLASREL